MNQIKLLQKKLKHPLLIQICQQPSDLLIEWWLHLLVHQFVKRTNTAVANPHKIFICNTCFTIGIDPLSLVAGEVLTSSQTRRQSQEDKLKAGNESVLMPSTLHPSVPLQFYSYSLSLIVTTHRRWHDSVSAEGLFKVSNPCLRAEMEEYSAVMWEPYSGTQTFSFQQLNPKHLS